ncbi:MAG: enoyl-CoA hydratase/isomerase family protein [Chloroflexi bacterium]|nr:enoyl-CoA hydratase/isomerase family protein [Chloroflexota bacterium]
MSYETILVETRGNVGLIRLNRPKMLNALNSILLKELMEMLETFDADKEIGAMVVTGSDKAFAAGADINQMSTASAVEMLKSDFIPTFDRIRAIKKPIIAAVSGYALGGGSELALSCDMIVASETAKFGQPEINLGVIPGAGGTQRLAKAVGKAIAMEMVVNNRTLRAEEALHYGIVNYVVPKDAYLEKALSLAAKIAARAPLAVQMGKEAVNLAFETHLSEGLADERRSFILLFSSEDQKEGMAAFIEKRTPQWKGK